MTALRWLRNPWARAVLVLAMLVLAVLAVWWRGPDWGTVDHAFAVAVLRAAAICAASRLSTRASVSPARTESPKRLVIRAIEPAARAVRTASPPGWAVTVA